MFIMIHLGHWVSGLLILNSFAAQTPEAVLDQIHKPTKVRYRCIRKTSPLLIINKDQIEEPFTKTNQTSNNDNILDPDVELESETSEKDSFLIKLTTDLDPLFELELVEQPSLASSELVSEINQYVKYAGASYCEAKWFGWYPCDYCKLFDKGTTEIRVKNSTTDTHALIAVVPNQSEIVVAFRGSDSISKFFEAASDDYIPYDGIEEAYVHKNYFEFYMSVHNQLIDNLVTLFNEHPKYRLIITGHSLGGSLATLAAPLLHKDIKIPYSQMRIITYGQPRVGNLAYAQYYNNLNINFTRVVNGLDSVVEYPAFSEGWVHTHQEVWINNGEHLQCITTKIEHPHCSFDKTSYLGFLAYHESVNHLKLSPHGCWLL